MDTGMKVAQRKPCQIQTRIIWQNWHFLIWFSGAGSDSSHEFLSVHDAGDASGSAGSCEFSFNWDFRELLYWFKLVISMFPLTGQAKSRSARGYRRRWYHIGTNIEIEILGDGVQGNRPPLSSGTSDPAWTSRRLEIWWVKWKHLQINFVNCDHSNYRHQKRVLRRRAVQ